MMGEDVCKGVNRDGSLCKYGAVLNGFCMRHFVMFDYVDKEKKEEEVEEVKNE